MAATKAEVTVTGWVNNVRTFDWGNAFSLSVEHRKQNDRGEWETVDRTNFDVTSSETVPDAKQVTITGKVVGTSTYAKKDGTQGVSVKVRAVTLEAVAEADLPF